MKLFIKRRMYETYKGKAAGYNFGLFDGRRFFAQVSRTVSRRVSRQKIFQQSSAGMFR